MFWAHLVFGDINNHSNYNFHDRVDKLSLFRRISMNAKPAELENNKYSFYDVDNDSISVAFSDIHHFKEIPEVLNWVVSLYEELFRNNIPTTFGVNLLTSPDWTTHRGFVNNPRMIHMPDESFNRLGRVNRSELTSDSLIITKRLLELAKICHIPIIISVTEDGHLTNEFKGHFPSWNFIDLTDSLNRLPRKDSIWLSERNVKPWGLEKQNV